MKTAIAALALSALIAPAPLAAQQGGMLRTMPHGNYECALPGSASMAALDRQGTEDFRLRSASRYSTAEGGGVYILKGNLFTFTRGPRKGQRYLREGDNNLRKLDADGNRTKLLCVRRGG